MIYKVQVDHATAAFIKADNLGAALDRALTVLGLATGQSMSVVEMSAKEGSLYCFGESSDVLIENSSCTDFQSGVE